MNMYDTKAVSHQQVASFVKEVRSLDKGKTTDIIEKVRQLFSEQNTPYQERLMYGGVVFLIGEKLTAGVFPYTKHVSVEFSNGAQMKDPHGVLEGAGKHRRRIKLKNLDDISNTQLKHYISQANSDGVFL